MSWPSVLTRWSFDPPILVGLALLALLYWRGWRPLSVVRGARNVPAGRWNAASFYASLVVIFVALESPIDSLSAYLFSFHMIQHLLLIMVAAPLLLLGDPIAIIVRGIPLQPRRHLLGFLARQPVVHQVGRFMARFTVPGAVFIIFQADLYLWHWNPLFDLTLTNDTVHLLEHVCFLATALLFWSQVIDQRAIPARLTYLQRAVYTVLTAFASNLLAMYLVFTPRPLYAPYAHLTQRLYGLSALADQQIAGAIMWVPVLFMFGGAFAVCFYKALSSDEGAETYASLTTPYSTLYSAPDATVGPLPR